MDEGDTMETTTDSDPLAALGLTREDLLEDLAVEREARATGDKRVCACGHGMNRHSEVDLGDRGVVKACNPTGSSCPCKRQEPVLTVSDTRPFLRKTLGGGRQHALLRGLAGLLEKEGRSFDWLEGWPKCELAGWDVVECGGPTLAYGVTEQGRMAKEPAPWNFMLCQNHGVAVAEHGMPT